MRILGIDPGLARTGWALVEKDERGTRLLESGLVETSAGLLLPDRLRRLHGELTGIIRRLAPTEAAVEELFFLKAAPSIQGTLEARGVILLAAAQAGLSIFPYNPRAVKLTLTGNGDAAKSQIQKLIMKTLSLDAILRPDDVADAAAIALCHLAARRSSKLRVLERVGRDA